MTTQSLVPESVGSFPCCCSSSNSMPITVLTEAEGGDGHLERTVNSRQLGYKFGVAIP